MNMSKNGGLEDDFLFPFNWVIFRFQSLIFQGVGKYAVRPIDPSWVFDFLC